MSKIKYMIFLVYVSIENSLSRKQTYRQGIAIIIELVIKPIT